MERQLTYEQVFASAVKGDLKSKKILTYTWQILADDYYLKNFETKEDYKENTNQFNSFINELISSLEEKEEKILPEDMNEFIKIEMKEIPLQRKRTYCSYE